VFISVHPWFNSFSCGLPRCAFCDFSRPISNPQSAIRNPKSEIHNPQSAIRNAQTPPLLHQQPTATLKLNPKIKVN
jgi:hypothetical protein